MEKKMKHRKTNYTILGLLLPVAILAAWQLATSGGYVSTVILPSPEAFVEKFFSLVKGGILWKNLSVSFARVLKGYAIGAVLGIVIGIGVGQSKVIDRLLGTTIGVLRSIPIIGWIPLIILWAGIGEASKLIVIAMATFFSVWVNTVEGIRSVDSELLEVATMFEKDFPTVLWRVILPAATPGIITGLRLGISNAWKAVVTAELLAASSGLGYMISYAREMAQPAVVLIGVLIIGLVGWLLDIVLVRLQRHLVSWNTGKE